MKPYLLFAGSRYYPMGGVNDYIDQFDTIEQAYKHFEDNISFQRWEWFQIVDHTDMSIVKS